MAHPMLLYHSAPLRCAALYCTMYCSHVLPRRPPTNPSRHMYCLLSASVLPVSFCTARAVSRRLYCQLTVPPTVPQVGYKSVLHIHTAVEECEITKLVAEIDMKTKEQKKAKFIKQVRYLKPDLSGCISAGRFACLPSHALAISWVHPCISSTTVCQAGLLCWTYGV